MSFLKDIRYVKLNGEKYYLQEIFDSVELMANIDKNAVAVKNSVYDHIIEALDGVELQVSRDWAGFKKKIK